MVNHFCERYLKDFFIMAKKLGYNWKARQNKKVKVVDDAFCKVRLIAVAPNFCKRIKLV